MSVAMFPIMCWRFWKIQLGNFFYYVRELRDPSLVPKYARDLKPDAWDRWFFDRGWLGLALGIAALCGTLGLGWGLFASALHAFTYVFVLSSSINGLCHHVGYRNFDNTATNVRIVAWLTGGEGLHNNHHRFPRSPKFSFRRGRRWEIDPGWWLVRALRSPGVRGRWGEVQLRKVGELAVFQLINAKLTGMPACRLDLHNGAGIRVPWNNPWTALAAFERVCISRHV